MKQTAWWWCTVAVASMSLSGAVLGADGAAGGVEPSLLGISTSAVNVEVDGQAVPRVAGRIPVEVNAVHTFRWSEPRERTILVAAAAGFDRLVPAAAWLTDTAAAQKDYPGYRLATGKAESAEGLQAALGKAAAEARAVLAGSDGKPVALENTELLEWRIVPGAAGVQIACLVGAREGKAAATPAAEPAASGPVPGWVFAPARAKREHQGVERLAIGIGTGVMARERAMAQARSELAGGNSASVQSERVVRPGMTENRISMRVEGVVSGSRQLATWEMLFEGQPVTFVLVGAAAAPDSTATRPALSTGRSSAP